MENVFKIWSLEKVQEMIFSRTCANDHHLPIYFDNIPVTQTTVKNIFGCVFMKITITKLS